MPRKSCDRCSKSGKSGNSRSHSNIATKRTFSPNLQSKRVDGKKVRICASCIRTEATASRKSK